MRRAPRLAVAALVGLAVGLPCLSVFVTEGALHIWQRTAPVTAPAEVLCRQTGASWEDVKAASTDGVVLRAWLFTPREPNGAAVIALHGVGDNRLGMMAHAAFLVRKTVFAYYLNDHHGDGIISVCCKVLPGDNEALIAAHPERFYMPAYIGPRGWVALAWMSAGWTGTRWPSWWWAVTG